MSLIDDAANFANRGVQVATAAASAVSVNGGLNVLPGGNGVQTWNTVSAAAAAAVAVGPGATATAFANAGPGGAQAAATAGAGANTFVQGGQGVGPQAGVNSNLLLDGVGKVLSGVGEILQGLSGVPVSQPNPAECGGLKADAASASVTTSGGYKIEATGKFNWQITGPDGKVTKIHGDPHVNGKTNWDFKKDATFVLGDGTRINVKTQPYGNGATVTSKLEIEKGGQVVNIDGIAQGKGKVGEVHQGKADFTTNETFVEGQESNTWSFNGKEILGSNGADNFKLGKDLAPALPPQAAAGAGATAGAQPAAGAPAQPAAGGLGPVAQQGQQLAQNGGLAQILSQVLQVLTSLIGLLGGGQQPQPAPAPQPAPEPQRPAPAPLPAPLPRQPPVDPGRGGQITDWFNALGGMFVALGKVLELAGSVPQQPRALNA